MPGQWPVLQRLPTPRPLKGPCSPIWAQPLELRVTPQMRFLNILSSCWLSRAFSRQLTCPEGSGGLWKAFPPLCFGCPGCCCLRPALTHPTPGGLGERSRKCTLCLSISEARPAQHHRTGITGYPRGTGPSPCSLSLEAGLGAADSSWRLAGGAAGQACGTGPSSRTLSLQIVTSLPSSPLTSGWPPASA